MARVKITETVLRDGHQSIAATRMRLRQMLPVLEAMDEVGYNALECWGGATFDTCMRFLDEDPWERLRTIKKHVKKTPLQMLFRGQNILGYRHYADDVVYEFVNRAVDNGIDIIRVFDALNDPRNLESSIKAAKDTKSVHVQGALVYTISPIHTMESFTKVAKELQDMGVDSICIKDMSGLLSPYDAYNLIRMLKKHLSVPIELHTHCTCGLGEMTYMKAIEAGVDIIDTALSPFGEITSQPATESMVMALQHSIYDTDIDVDRLWSIVDHFKHVRKELEDEFKLTMPNQINPAVRKYQIPGGMLTNLYNQLKPRAPKTASTKSWPKCPTSAATSAIRRWLRRPARSPARQQPSTSSMAAIRSSPTKSATSSAGNTAASPVRSMKSSARCASATNRSSPTARPTTWNRNWKNRRKPWLTKDSPMPARKTF